jgi:microfibrillar-associated protein 1
MSTTAGRKQAPRPARPAARYWKGKAPKGIKEADSDSDEEDTREKLDNGGDVPLGGEQEFAVADDVEEPEVDGRGGVCSFLNLKSCLCIFSL